MRKLSEVLVRTGTEVYHEIVRVSMYSLLSSLALLPLVFLVPTPIAAALVPVVYFPLLFGVFAVFHRKSEGLPWGTRFVLTEAIRGFLPAFVFGLFCTVLVLILISSWWYYGGKEGFFPLSLAVFQTYFVAMAFVSQIYTIPLVICKKMNIFRAAGESAKLFFRHPAYTFWVFFQMLVVSAALLATVVGFAVLWAGTIGVFMNLAAKNVFELEDADADRREETSFTR